MCRLMKAFEPILLQLEATKSQKKILERGMEGGFEGLNLQFRTTFLNVEHFYDDQFRKERGSKKTTKETKRRVKSSWESHFPRSFKFFGPDLVFRHLINITKYKYSNVMALKKQDQAILSKQQLVFIGSSFTLVLHFHL